MTLAGIWLYIGGGMLYALSMGTLFAVGFADGTEANTPATGFLWLILGGMLLLFAAAGALVTGRVLLYIASFRIWRTLHDALAARGQTPRVGPVGMLMIELFGPMAVAMIGWVIAIAVIIGMASTKAPAGVAIGVIIGLYVLIIAASYAPYAWVVATTQKRTIAVATARPSALPNWQ